MVSSYSVHSAIFSLPERDTLFIKKSALNFWPSCNINFILLQAQSRKTFKFKSRKKMLEDSTDVDESGMEAGEGAEKVEMKAVQEEQHPVARPVKQTFKPISVTSAVVRYKRSNTAF